MTNEQRAEALINELGFEFDKIDKSYIRQLIEDEVKSFQEGSSEYIRLLCGYLFCIGDESDIELIKKAKYNINFDVGCMIDQEWIDSLANGGAAGDGIRSKDELIKTFAEYYRDFEPDDF